MMNTSFHSLMLKMVAVLILAGFIFTGSGIVFAAPACPPPGPPRTATVKAGPVTKANPVQQAKDLVAKAKAVRCQDENAAITNLAKATQLDPKNLEAWTLLGELYTSRNRFDNAMATYQKALASFPSNPQLWFGYGYAQGRMGLPHEAIKSFDNALKYKPDYADCLKYRGMALMRMYRYKEAIENLATASQLNPKDQYTLLFLGLATYESGDKDDGLKLVNDVLQKNPALKSEIPEDLRKSLGI